MPRSKRYQQVSVKVARGKLYPVTEALELAKSTGTNSFDASIDLHVRLVGRKPEDKQFRAQVILPHGTGKPRKVEILTEEKIDTIERSKQAPADVYLATPELMPKVAKIAKILGPKGKMPNPRSGTVTPKPEERLKDLSAGNSIEIRTDPTGILHTSFGKVSWPTEKLASNGQAILKVIPRGKIGSMTVSATMGPGIPVSKD